MSRRWIASREYQAAGTRSKFTVRIGEPTLGSHREWNCEIEIAGAGLDINTSAIGEDSLQALLLGLSKLSIILETEPRLRGLSWLGQPGAFIELVGRSSA